MSFSNYAFLDDLYNNEEPEEEVKNESKVVEKKYVEHFKSDNDTPNFGFILAIGIFVIILIDCITTKQKNS